MNLFPIPPAHPRSAAAAGEGLVDAVASFRGSTPPVDHETVVALERIA
jgi:hypothetical protein